MVVAYERRRRNFVEMLIDSEGNVCDSVGSFWICRLGILPIYSRRMGLLMWIQY